MSAENFKIKTKRKSSVLVQLKRIIVHAQIKQRVDFFREMDDIGIELESEFEHWHRGAAFLHLRNLKEHRGFLLTSRDLVLTHHSESLTANDYASACVIFGKVLSHLKRETIDSVNIVSNFARAAPRGFDDARDRICESLVTPTEEFLDVVGDVADVGYTIITNRTGCKINIAVGPMNQEEWFRKIAYELNDGNARLFGSTEDFDKFRRGIPKQLYFLEVGSLYEKVVPDKFATSVKNAGDTALKMADEVGGLLN